MLVRVRGRWRARATILALLGLMVVMAAPFGLITYRSIEILAQGEPGRPYALTAFLLVGLPFIGWLLRFLENFLFAVERTARAEKARVITARMVKRRQVTDAEAELYELAAGLAARAGLGKPKVGVVPRNEMNAFAVGRRSHYLIALNVGLCNRLLTPELSAVIAHELGHVGSGDTTLQTLALAIQDSLMTFFVSPLLFLHDLLRALPLMILALVLGLGYAIHVQDYHLAALLGAVLALPQLAYMVLLACRLVIASLGRWREFHADAAGAALTSPDAMINALRRIELEAGGQWIVTNPLRAPALGGLAIRNPFAFGGLGGRLFATHPPMADRMRALAESRFR